MVTWPATGVLRTGLPRGGGPRDPSPPRTDAPATWPQSAALAVLERLAAGSRLPALTIELLAARALRARPAEQQAVLSFLCQGLGGTPALAEALTRAPAGLPARTQAILAAIDAPEQLGEALRAAGLRGREREDVVAVIAASRFLADCWRARADHGGADVG
ncbi:MAG: hypothetical protein R3A51_18005 [Nannocystaceae bacterium]|nr:hypothetical protein [Myxococcales bacterium]